MQVQVQLSKASYWRRRNENRNSESCCQQTTCDGRHRREFSSLTTSDRSWSPSWLPRATATGLRHGPAPAAVGMALGLPENSVARRSAAPARWHQDGRGRSRKRRREVAQRVAWIGWARFPFPQNLLDAPCLRVWELLCSETAKKICKGSPAWAGKATCTDRLYLPI